MMISNMWHSTYKFKHSHVPLIVIIITMSFLFQCVVNSTTRTSTTMLRNQLVAKAGKQIKCIDKDRHALLDFKAMNLQDPSDNDCFSALGTKKEDVDDDCCNWSGVTCNNQTARVTELRLYGCGLEGEMSPSLLNLTHLTLLGLSSNRFNGTILKSIGSLTNLRVLDLSYNSFSGNIPNSIGSLSELRYLKITGNSFNGSIPKSIGSLTKLTNLLLDSNSFSGPIPESIGSLTELTYLDLSNNSFCGNIPPELGNLVNLEHLFLKNIGKCSVDNISWLSPLSHLEGLFIDGISLAKVDHWVNVILSLRNLTVLCLQGCELSQVMHPYSSSSHLNYSSSSNIASLFLGNNNLNSSMYPWLYPLVSNNLYILDLSGNKLDEIPRYFGSLCSLRQIYFSTNSAIVTFSDFLKTLSAGCTSETLVYLEASSSQLTGSISDDIQHFSSLRELNLSHNQLNGTISEKIWELSMINRLDISFNSLRGEIFEKIGKSEITYINLSSNNFSGKADALSTFNSSAALDLSSNKFFGPVTYVSSTLSLLNLSKNKFYGGIFFLCQTVDSILVSLDLSHNSFSGQIPDCLWHFKYLKVLNLAENNLSGRLPTSVEYLIDLDVLDLYNNNFSGELPLSLRHCTNLTFLDLGANRFSGNMPIWIGESLLELYVLSLGSNDFFGPIPLQFCQLVNLQVLDLSMNNLNGHIPSCVNNLTSMVQQGFLSIRSIHTYRISGTVVTHEFRDYTDNAIVQWQGIRREFTNNLGLLKSIDLSSNNLTGQIPNELTDLRVLLALNLSRNALFGEIPQKIGHMKDLMTLDLSRNQFSRGVPSSISEMTSLSWLDVSYNDLSGRIPSSTQLQTFNATSYTGNAKLCGLPLSKYCPGDEELQVSSPVDESDIDKLERWFYIGGAIGFAIGFWIVCITLLVIRRGRQTFFNFLDTLEDWIYVKVLVFKAKFE